MTVPNTVAGYIQAAREAIAAGDLEAATKYKDQAAALKRRVLLLTIRADPPVLAGQLPP